LYLNIAVCSATEFNTSFLSEGSVPSAVRFSCRNVNKVDGRVWGGGVRNKHVNGRDIFRLSFVLKSNHSGHGTANRVQKGVMGKGVGGEECLL